ncbi:uncharacterized protein G2W53_035790 [Senna tora]|uniref:Uncharacterized protein n=1 Tax=Senna tora TaxID=362788 RepID=A0A834W4F4_9FABA|nr:uncharacterized protein G2W53_035790 [Senna tora]
MTHLLDRWAWKGESNGNFSVKSGYKLAMRESWENMNLTPDLFCDVPTSFWKSMWKLPILSRWGREKQCVFVMVIYFIWEARNQRKFANEVVNLNGVWAKVERQWGKACVAVRSSGEGALGVCFVTAREWFMGLSWPRLLH